MILNFSLVFFSFLIVAFGAPSLSSSLSMAASAFGYALFWRAAFRISRRFCLATLWFAAIQAVQLNWLATTHYMGPLIVVVYLLVILALGVQFGLLTALARMPLSWKQILGLSGFWVLMEWSRLFFLTGFTWNPVGLSLAANDYSIQFASMFGIYGLCFWVILTNLAALKSKRIWLCLALFPYFFGLCHQMFWEGRLSAGKKLNVALVQTAMKPEQRDLLDGQRSDHIHPQLQWKRILNFLKEKGDRQYDLIVLPEGALPAGVRKSIYPLNEVKQIWSEFGSPESFPVTTDSHVTNAFWLQSLSNHFGAEVIVGLDDFENGLVYNAAFHFTPNVTKINRYEKQVLIPIGEYIPLKPLTQFFSEQYGITGSFASGQKTKIFQGIIPIGIFICLEETYSHLVRKNRSEGAELFVNITNDVWFPRSRLPWHHLEHGKIRSAENGVYLLRSCNTGVTAIVDCFGKLEEILPVSEEIGGVLTKEIKVRSFPTLYTFWGDFPALILSLGFFLMQNVKKKLLGIRVLG